MLPTVRTAALSASLLIAAAVAPIAAHAAGGYFDRAGAPLVGPTEYDTGGAAATPERQQASHYFSTVGSPLVQPTEALGDAADTLAKQRASGYFPDAGAPLVSPETERH